MDLSNILVFCYRDRTRKSVLDQQGISEQFQHSFSAPPGSSMICQLFREWLNDLEHLGHFAFVMGKFARTSEMTRSLSDDMSRN